jgi:hypothetical protein
MNCFVGPTDANSVNCISLGNNPGTVLVTDFTLKNSIIDVSLRRKESLFSWLFRIVGITACGNS